MKKTLIETIFELLPVIGIGAFGGFIRTLAGKSRAEPYRLAIAIPEIFLAVFAGLLIHWLTAETALPESYRTAAIALGGYSSRSVIALLNAVFINKLKGK